jgi:hypothetical protein
MHNLLTKLAVPMEMNMLSMYKKTTMCFGDQSACVVIFAVQVIEGSVCLVV